MLPEQVLGGVADGSSSGRSSAHVGDALQSVDGVVFVGVVKQAKLQPLIVGELNRTWTSNKHSVSSSINQSINPLIKLFSSCEADRCELPRLRCRSFWRFLPGSPGPAGSFHLRRWMNHRWGTRCSPSCSRFYLKNTHLFYTSTFSQLDTKLFNHHCVNMWKRYTYYDLLQGEFVTKSAVDIHSPLKTKFNDSGDFLTFSLAPPSQPNFTWKQEKKPKKN